MKTIKQENQKVPDNQRLVIIDGNAIIHRAYHAIPPLTAKGTMVNAVYGFTSMLLKVLADLKPTHLVVCFDVSGGTFRDDLYTDYKATRVKVDQDLYDQIPLVYEMVNAFNIPIYTKAGFEADDVIGTIVQKNKKTIKQKNKLDIIVVTGDMDLLQLVTDGVSVYELRKGLADIVLFDAEKVKEKYGFGPEMVVDYKALRGDASDNIPGVPGVGEKTATELITKIGGIEKIYGQLEHATSPIYGIIKSGMIEKLKKGAESARLSRVLATIRQDVPDISFQLKDAKAGAWDAEKIRTTFQKFEFFSLLKRVPGLSTDSTTASSVTRIEKKKLPAPTVITSENFSEHFPVLQKETILACREVTSGGEVYAATIQGLLFAVPAGTVYYLEYAKCSSIQKKKLQQFFSDTKRMLIGHDLKQLVKVLQLQDIFVQCDLFDTMVASYVLNSSTRAHDLASLIQRELQKPVVEAAQETLFGADTAVLAEDLRSIVAIYGQQKKALAEHKDLGLFDNIEMKLIPVLADMELAGVAVDLKRLQELSGEVANAIGVVTKKIWSEAGEEFNVASSLQLRDVLFDKMKLPVAGVKKGKTGLSTAASELEKLRDLHPIIAYIEEHRELAKLQNTYIDVLPTLVNKKTGRIHTSYNQTVAATGRLSSTDPNLQNIPIRTELGKKIRQTFIAPEGYVLIAADYSQFELRIVASLAQDKKMMEIFQKGDDIHRATAAAIHGVTEAEVTPAMRYAAKEVNFGVLYGMGAYGLASRTGIPQVQAQAFIEKYFQEFSGVKQYVEDTVALAKKEGYVETLFGRRRYIPEVRADNFQLRAAGERMAVNMPIQGTQADLIKMAMIEVHAWLAQKKPEARMILQVHDELVFEVPENLAEAVAATVKKIMEGVVTLRVPIEVHVHIGKRWGDLK